MVDVSCMLSNPHTIILCDNDDEVRELVDSVDAASSSALIVPKARYYGYHRDIYFRVDESTHLVHGTYDQFDPHFSDWTVLRFRELSEEDSFCMGDLSVEWLLGMEAENG